MKKRWISLMLAMVMLFSTLPVGTLAVEADRTGGQTVAEEVETEVPEEPTESEHNHIYAEVVTVPTCTEQGYTTYTCTCGESYMDDYVDATGHTAVIDAAVAGTCTESGLTEGSHCAACGEVLVVQEVISAQGHSWEAATCENPETCSVCGAHQDDALGHDYVEGVCTRCQDVTTWIEAPVVTASNVKQSGKVRLTWEAVDGAVEYKVYRSETKGGKYRNVYTTTGTSYTNTAGVAGVKYYYYVAAVAEDGTKSENNKIVFRTCDLAQPEVTATNVAKSGKVKLSWKAADGAVKYRVYRSEEKDGDYKNVYTTDGTTYTNTNAVAGTKYYYKVKAIAENTDANSAYSAIRSRTCDLARPIVSKSRNSAGKPKLTWEAIDGAISYRIYRSASGEEGTYKLTYTASGTAYINTNAEKSKNYFYKVRAIAENTDANSAYACVEYTKADSLGIAISGNYTPSDRVIDAIENGIQNLTSKGYRVGFMLVDLRSGQSISYNADEKFYCASTIKGPYVCSAVSANPSAITNYASSIKNILYYSSNEDYTALRNRYGNDCMVKWCKAAGIDANIGSQKWPDLTAEELCKLWIQNYTYFNADSTGEKLGRLFQKPEVSPIRSVLGSDYKTQTKAGWINGSNAHYQAANDAGIVYADNGAYAVAIMSNASAKLSLLNTLIRALDATHSEMG